MLKRAWLIVTLLVIPLIFAQSETSNVELTFVDAVSKEQINDVFIKIDLNEETSNYFLDSNQPIKLKLENGKYNLKVLVSTPGKRSYDYYGDLLLSVKKDLIKIIYLHHVGSLNGLVKDESGVSIVGADLRFDCNKELSLNYPDKTDKFGSFSLDYVPVGNCRIYGKYKDQSGFGDVKINQGEKNLVEIKLDTTLVSTNYNYLLFSIILIFVLVTFFLIYYFRRKSKYLNKKEKQEEKEVKVLKNELKEIISLDDLGQRGKDIFKTLRKNEKRIIEFLVEQKEPVYFSKIHYKTGLSKGSLSRNIKSLEDKNIIKTFKEGKIRKIKLSEWFLEK